MRIYILLFIGILMFFSCKTNKKVIVHSIITSADSLPQRQRMLSNEQQDSIIAIHHKKALAYEDSLMKVMQWKPLKEGLSISRFGDIGFKTAYVVGAPELIETYRTNFCCQDGKSFKDVIDIETFRLIGGDWGWGGYFKDKNHTYHFWGNSGGGNFYIEDKADLASFKKINDCYLHDKNHVYHLRFGIMDDVDPKDFKTIYYKERCLAKYRDSYYEEYDQLTPEELADPEIQEAIKLLDKL